jgi:cell division septation protein DedD
VATGASTTSPVKAGVDAWSAGDFAGAIRLWQPLADKGDPDAQFNLAQAYKLGRGVPVDLARAEDLYGKAAAKGHLQAADSYGLLLFQRGERTRALPYVQASASRGDPRAQYLLGVAHFNGDVVAKDWVRAYALVSLARQAGLPQATRALAQMDAHIPLEDRQKSVLLSQRIAAETEANRARLAASSELGGPETAHAEIAEVRVAAEQAERIAIADGPDSAGADYSRPTPATPAKAKPTSPPSPVAAKPAPKAVAQAPKVATKPLLKVEPKSSPAAGPWRVQLGAFGVPGNVEALWTKVRGRPELAGHARALVPSGKVTKLQATGFASQAAAQAACAKLAAGGFACLTVRD